MAAPVRYAAATRQRRDEPWVPDKLSTGSVIGGFLVGAFLARGAMGAVYLAGGRERAAGRAEAALAELAHDDRFRQRFLRESRVAATLDHPNAGGHSPRARTAACCTWPWRTSTASTCASCCAAKGRFDRERAVAIVRQAGEALDAAHAAGLVHRDVKPGNILVADGPYGEHAYVCDFGLARHVSSVGSLTGDRGFVGTVDYVAPEQIRGEKVDGRADVYSLGRVDECLAGERPFERESELAVVFAHLKEPPPRLDQLRPELPAAWDRVVARALAKEPEGATARAVRSPQPRATRCTGALPRGGRLAGCSPVPLAGGGRGRGYRLGCSRFATTRRLSS